MPPKKRASLSRVDQKAKQMRESRAAETTEQRDARLQQNRLRMAESRAAETSEQRDTRLEENRLRMAESRAAETSEERDSRLDENRLRMAESRAAETPEQRNSRLEEQRQRTAELRAIETPGQRGTRLEDNRLRMAESRAAETSEQRDTRLEENRLRMAESRAAETSEERNSRLEEQRQRTAELRAIETPGQRGTRLEDNRLRMAESRAAETSEQHYLHEYDEELYYFILVATYRLSDDDLNRSLQESSLKKWQYSLDFPGRNSSLEVFSVPQLPWDISPALNADIAVPDVIKEDAIEPHDICPLDSKGVLTERYSLLLSSDVLRIAECEAGPGPSCRILCFDEEAATAALVDMFDGISSDVFQEEVRPTDCCFYFLIPLYRLW
ncbi:hypothetical protein ANCCAN_03971 [Ancylostoma caninum]|uniref:STPR domain-containing protein n=1 Tax=Ancylostoma caninum TaxID=29170 RepID=A0A368H3U6_ANCCA|nr:hypothetical protein ANCCAN_03971 [Ancylostoma caninum]